MATKKKLPYRLIHLDPHNTKEVEREMANFHDDGYRLKFVGSDAYAQGNTLLLGVMELDRQKQTEDELTEKLRTIPAFSLDNV